MKTKNFLKYVLSGLLLTSAPLCVFAADINVPNNATTAAQRVTMPNSGGITVDAGVAIEATGPGGAGTVKYRDAAGVDQTANFTVGADTIRIPGAGLSTIVDTGTTWGVHGVTVTAVAGADLANKTIDIGNLNLSGVTNTGMTGFAYNDDFAGAAQPFNATLLRIGNVSVTNNGGVGTWSDGVYFRDISGSNVTVGNINATGNNARGFQAGNLLAGATVTLGNVDVTVSNSNAATDITRGVDVTSIGDGNALNGSEKLSVGNVNVTTDNANGVRGVSVNGNINTDGSLEVKDVTVRSTGGTGSGVRVTGLVVPGSNFSVGKIQVDSTSNAYGIAVQGNTAPSAFTVTNDVIARTSAATNAGVTADGIVTTGNSQNITIDTKDGDVQISGIATNSTGNNARSINMGGGNDTLLITGANKHTNKGQEFDVLSVENVRWSTDAEYNPISSFTSSAATTHQVATDNTAIVHGFVAVNNGNSYTIGSAADNNSAGILVLHNLVAGNVSVNNGLLALDGNTSNAIGTLTIGNANPLAQAPAAVALYGNTLANNVGLALAGEPTILGNAVVDPTTNERVLSLSTITEYKLNPAKTAYVAQNRARASLADGFLLPASIHRYNTGWEATRDHLISGGQRVKVSKGILGQASCDPCEPICETKCDPCEEVSSCNPCEEVSCNPCDPCGFNKGGLSGLSLGRSVWVNYIGRSNSYRSSYSNIGINNGDWEIGTDGIQVGLDLYKSSKAQLGLLFGYEGSKATLRSDRLDADDTYFGVYAARVFANGADFRVVYNYGSQDYTLNRLDPGLGFDWHSHNSAFDGNTHEVNLELGKRVFMNRRWSYRPVIGFDLLVNDWDGTQEDGNLSTAIAYDGADYTQAFLRIGSDL
ncbi:MAG: autotransporter domain-containing protein, partial [Planctomycetaceae bacterium]|nr:autotransporter domain-containing protein [Planctomycetaceae bacterium]